MDHPPFVSSLSNRRSVLLSLAAPLLVFAQQDTKPKDKPVVYTPGGDVKPPKVIHYVEPAFADTSKEAFVDGVVKLKTTVTTEGMPSEIEVIKGLSEQEDRNAVEAVKQWRFQPGTKSGEPVYVRVGIEIAFHLE